MFDHTERLRRARFRTTRMAAGVSLCLATGALLACDKGPAAPTEPRAIAPHGINATITPNSNRIGIVFLANDLDAAPYANKLVAAQTMAAAGVQWARIPAYWVQLQQGTDNSFNPPKLAELHATVDALVAAGITPYISLETTACFARDTIYPCSSNQSSKLPTNHAHWDALRTYVQQMMNEFPNVQYWSIWNEPNVGYLIEDGSSNRLTAYEALVDTIAPFIRGNNRTVIVGELADDIDSTNPLLTKTQWLDALLQHDASLTNIVAVHLYGSTGGVDPGADGGAAAMAAYNGVLSQRAPSADLWLTEVSYSVGWPLSDDDQTRSLAHIYDAALGAGTGRWSKTFYFSAGVFSPTENRGLVHNLGFAGSSPRPAYYCLSQLSQWGPGNIPFGAPPGCQ